MKFILLLLLSISLTVHSETLHQYQVLRVLDGDTIIFKADFLPEPLKKELSLRIFGVDTPEKGFRAKCPRENALGVRASEFTLRRIQESSVKQIELKSWDKYGGRVLGDIYLDGRSLRGMLLNEGLAREYFGEKKLSWCD